MSQGRNYVISLLLLGLFASPSFGKDFPEPPALVDPLASAAGPGAAAGLGAAFEYGNYCLSHDDVDSFYFRVGASPVLFAHGDGFALGGNYESVLMCGPVPTGDTPATVAAFWMNAIQFEYGLYASLALPGGVHALAEYSRTSQHPFAGRSQYSAVSADILMLGLASPRLRAGPARIDFYARFGYRDLYDFWEASIPKPRASWILKPAAEARLPLSGRLSAVARAYPEVFYDRKAERLDADAFGEAGLSLDGEAESEELLFTIYGTRDSELLKNEAHPCFEAGLSLRFSRGRSGPARG
jgi:hypothetical protein